jgi:hypothetical protein
MSSLSNSAIEAKILVTNLPCGDVVSTGSFKNDKLT